MIDREKLIDAILVFYGVNMTEEDRENLKRSRAMGLPPDSKAEYVIKNINEADAEVLRKTIASDIHKFSMTPDLSDESFAGNSSGVAILYKILDVSESLLSNQELFKEITQKLNRCNKATISADIIKENAVIGTISKSPAQSAKGAEGRDFYEIKISQKPQKVNSDRFLAPKTTKPRLRTQSRTYWQKRSVERTLESERQSLPYLRQSRQVYAKSARE